MSSQLVIKISPEDISSQPFYFSPDIGPLVSFIRAEDSTVVPRGEVLGEARAPAGVGNIGHRVLPQPPG